MLSSAFKTREVPDKFRPHSKNKLYAKIETRVQCEVCKRGNRQCHVYKKLWQLYMHVTIQHPYESTDFIVNQARILAKEGKKA